MNATNTAGGDTLVSSRAADNTLGTSRLRAALGGAITALITPMTENGVDYDSFAKLVGWQIDSGIDGVVPTGTTGESPTLTHDEHDRVVRLCVERVAGRVPVIAGTGSNNTREAIRLSQEAQKSGADALLVVVPYYNKPSQQGLLEHYRLIHDNTDLPIVVYDIPGRSVVGVDDETFAQLAAMPRIVGVKDARGSVARVEALRAHCGDDFVQLSGDDPSAMGYCAHGGHGVISVSSNVAPNDMHNMLQAVRSGDIRGARAINHRLAALHVALFWQPSPAATKYACWRAGIIADPVVRLPITPLSDEVRQRLDAVLDAAQPK